MIKIDQFIKEAEEIILLIKSKDFVDLPIKFNNHLDNIKSISDYHKYKWQVNYCEKIYDIGKECLNPNVFEVLNSVIEKKEENEIFDFIRSEMFWNFFEQDNFYNKEQLLKYLKKYPNNPEFHHTYSHFLEKNNQLDRSMMELKFAIKLSNNKNYIWTYLCRVKSIFNNLVAKDIKKAEEFFNKEKSFYYDNVHFISDIKLDGILLFNNINDRINDYINTSKIIENFQREIENTVQIQQRKIIEILGVFSAIVAFILTNISMALKSLSVKEMLTLMFGMAIILLIFTISISFLFGKRYRYNNRFSFLKNIKFWAIIFLFLVLLFLIYKN